MHIRSTIHFYVLKCFFKILIIFNFYVVADVIIQRHVKGAGGQFPRPWRFYKNGFGSEGANYYWAGLDTIHGITSSGSYSLEIELTTGGQTKTVKWGTFTVGSESNKYQLSLSGFDAGTSGLQDGLTPHNGMFFSTRDVDNDQWSGGCSSQYGNTGWWYKDCAVTNLNIAHTRGPWYATQFFDESRMILKRY